MDTSTPSLITWPHNPVVDVELTHQRRMLRLKRRWQRWIGRLAMYAGLTVAMILYSGTLAGALLGRDSSTILTAMEDWIILFVVFAAAMHFVFLFQTVSLAANSISRERQSDTWDLLVLTGVSSKRLVYGKWWATVRRQWRSYLKLALLQLGAVGVVSMASVLIARSFSSYYSSYNSVFPTVWQVLGAGGAVIALTFADLCFSAAWGMLVSMNIRRAWAAMAWAFTSRILLMLGTWLIISRMFYTQGGLIFGLLTLIDNGVLLAGEWASMHFVSDNFRPQPLEYVLIVLFTLAAYAGITRLILFATERRLHREMGYTAYEG